MESSSIAFTDIPVRELNEMVRCQIAEHLFIACKYDPNVVKVYSEDARYIAGILNLYKFFIDASICNKMRRLCEMHGAGPEYEKLKEIIDTICMLRSVIAHNVDGNEDEGTNESEYNNWTAAVIGKHSIEGSDDFRRAGECIEQYGIDSICILKDILKKLYDSATTDDMLDILTEIGLQKEVANSIASAIKQRCMLRFELDLDVILVDMEGNYLNDNMEGFL